MTWLCDQWKMLQCWWRMGHLPSFFSPPWGNYTCRPLMVTNLNTHYKGFLSKKTPSCFKTPRSEVLYLRSWKPQPVQWHTYPMPGWENFLAALLPTYTYWTYWPSKKEIFFHTWTPLQCWWLGHRPFIHSFWHRPTVKPVTHIPAFNWSTNVATLVVEQVATCCIQCISVLIQQCSVFQHSMRHGIVFIEQDRQNKLINKCWTVWP